VSIYIYVCALNILPLILIKYFFKQIYDISYNSLNLGQIAFIHIIGQIALIHTIPKCRTVRDWWSFAELAFVFLEGLLTWN